MSIFELIEQIASTPKKNEKIALLSQHQSMPFLKDVIEYTLHPRKIYGIKPDTSWLDGLIHGEQIIDHHTIQLLDKLVNRQYTGLIAQAKVHEYITELNKQDAELFIRILRKDFRAGFSISTVNKVWDNLIPKQLYMRCSLLSDNTWKTWDFSQGVYSQTKMDGLFIACDVNENVVQFTTRQNTIIENPQLDSLKKELEVFDWYQVHGELVMYQNGKPMPREISNGHANSLAKGGTIEDDTIIPTYVVWDMIPLHEVVKSQESTQIYDVRFKVLKDKVKNLKNVKLVDTKVFFNIEDCIKDGIESIKVGNEGTVMKTFNMRWKHGESKHQVKIKAEVEADLEVYGMEYGKKDSKYENQYATLKCRTLDDKVHVNVTIKNDKMRKAVNDNPDEWLNTIMVVRYNDLSIDFKTKEYSLYLPRFVESSYRIDKDKADTLDDIYRQLQNPFKFDLS